MKIIIGKISILFLGIAIGWLCSWVYSYFPSHNESNLDVNLDDIFKFSNTIIESHNYSCEGDDNRIVGAVLGSIFQSNIDNTRNTVSLDCFENKCGLIFNYCKPWQSQECGSRILRFDLNNDDEIIPESFVCIDLP